MHSPKRDHQKHSKCYIGQLVCAATCIGLHTRSTEVAVVTSSVVMIPGLSAPLPLLFFLHLAELSLETVGELEGAFRGSSPSSFSGPQAAAARALREDKRFDIANTLLHAHYKEVIACCLFQSRIFSTNTHNVSTSQSFSSVNPTQSL